ncbi:MAG: cytochrome c3 family protein [Chthoniobacterales bacterium]
MDEQRGTQKQIAKRYGDRVDYRNTRTPYRRTRFWITLLAVLAGAAAIYFSRKTAPPEFFNTGPLSRHHSHLKDGCASCHQAEPLSDESRFVQVLNDRFHTGAPSFERIDQACLQCHQQHAFHEPNVIANRSCSACHKEHQGSGAMHPVVSLDCATCHNDRAVMQASAERGKQIPPAQFHLNPKMVNPRAVTLQLPRPADGYTAAFTSFSEGHPPFQVHRDNVREVDVLRFNHQRHLSGNDIPATKSGAKLDCNYCHKPEPSGRYMQRVSFEAHCQECHSLQFDVRNPDFQLPHGDAQLVRTFLRTLPAQYGELARRKRGLTSDAQVANFAAQQVRQLLTQFPNAEELERSVFFTKDPYKASLQSDASSRAKYTGCAFCHEVKQGASVSYPTAEITKPVVIDRWLPHAHFDHAKHASVSSCRDCHTSAQASRLTSDVLIPPKENCVRCHSPNGQAAKASECMTCHIYHAPEQPLAAPVAVSVSFKQMLLAR